MDILAALNSQLDFVRAFYITAAPPFDALLRKYMTRFETFDEEPTDEFEKWQEARKGLEVLGQCSLSLVAKAMQDYLREFVRREASSIGQQKAKESWFDCYCRYLEESTSFRWDNSPVSRGQIEQINLCRNDFTHDPDIDGSQPKQSARHFEKHPRSRFDDALERAVMIAVAQESGEAPPNTPGSLTVTRHGLLIAIADARQFCAFVETQKTQTVERLG